MIRTKLAQIIDDLATQKAHYLVKQALDLQVPKDIQDLHDFHKGLIKNWPTDEEATSALKEGLSQARANVNAFYDRIARYLPFGSGAVAPFRQYALANLNKINPAEFARNYNRKIRDFAHHALDGYTLMRLMTHRWPIPSKEEVMAEMKSSLPEARADVNAFYNQWGPLGSMLFDPFRRAHLNYLDRVARGDFEWP